MSDSTLPFIFKFVCLLYGHHSIPSIRLLLIILCSIRDSSISRSHNCVFQVLRRIQTSSLGYRNRISLLIRFATASCSRSSLSQRSRTRLPHFHSHLRLLLLSLSVPHLHGFRLQLQQHGCPIHTKCQPPHDLFGGMNICTHMYTSTVQMVENKIIRDKPVLITALLWFLWFYFSGARHI